MIPSEECQIIEALRTQHSAREICEVLDFTRSNFYYQPKNDTSEDILRAEIEKLAAAYPTYGYRHITHLLVKAGYDVGYRRVARLMKSENLSVALKRACQTIHSTDSLRPWINHLKTLEVCRCDQVWVGDITYVRLKAHFVYVSLLMDVFTRKIRGWQVSQHLTQPLTFRPLEQALRQSTPEIHHSDQGAQYLCSQSMALRFRGFPVADVLGRTGMLRDSSAPLKRKKFTSMTMTTFTRRENVSGILSNTCIIRNVHIRH